MTETGRQESLARRCNELFRALNRLMKAEDSEWLGLDLGMGQLKAMIVLKEQDRQTVGGVARTLKIAEPSASLLIEKLVTRGMAVRHTDPDDRRRTIVALSASGDELMTRLRRSKEDQLIGWLAQLTTEELAGLMRGLEALLGVVDQTQTKSDQGPE